ncbi:MbnP family protein [Hymenobacter terricola]|uniref:MbnP family protein n=1 Tax=Hymenobacter terricola TaxID=2819236 RepID=UPI001B30156E|nr:MbnP family protein [Hymenobacter terricola]
MKRFPVFAFAVLLALATFGLNGCKKDEPVANTGEFTLHLENVVGTAPLDLDATTYHNANGDNFTVSTFKYYISNVTLRKADNSSYLVPNSYFLVDQSKAESQDLLMKNVPVGDYTGISFTVGVDSARTKAGNFTDVLNANNGMYWDMNGPEFINLKLEGRSPQAPSSGLIFHIAGYKHSTTNTIRTVTLPFPAVSLLIRPDHSPEIHTSADVLKMFTGVNPISFATIYNTMGGPNSVKVADNIAAGMFTVEHIHAN